MDEYRMKRRFLFFPHLAIHAESSRILPTNFAIGLDTKFKQARRFDGNANSLRNSVDVQGKRVEWNTAAGSYYSDERRVLAKSSDHKKLIYPGRKWGRRGGGQMRWRIDAAMLNGLFVLLGCLFLTYIYIYVILKTRRETSL